jgi:hypothetical protein
MDTRASERDPVPTLEPPRAVPFLLRCQLLANGPALWGSVIFGLSCLLVVGLVAGMDPVGTLRLAWNRQEAPGLVVAERDENYEEDGFPIRRHDYTFRLPDGTVLRGHSYSEGHKYLDVAAPGDPDPERWARVTVEYDPDHPEANRIKGTSTHLTSHWAAVMLVFPVVSLLVAVLGVLGGWWHIRLLRRGAITSATIISCKDPTNSESPADLPVAECRRLLAKQAELIERGPRSPFVFLWNGFHTLWRLAVWLMLVGGVLFIAFGIVQVLLGSEGFFVNGQPARGKEGALWLAGFLVVWVWIGGVMLAAGRAIRITSETVTVKVDCAYEFRLPHGEVIRSHDYVPGPVVANSEAPLPVLYNPNYPQESVLLATWAPQVRLSEQGEWESPGGLRPLLRLAVVAFALVCGPLLGAIIAGS